MQFHHHGYVISDPRIEPAAGRGVDRPDDLPDEMDVLIVGTGPAGMLLAAQMSQFPEVTCRIIEKRDRRLEIGQADGLQARSIETFQAFGFADRLLQEAYEITEMSFWRPSKENRDHIYRAEVTKDSAHDRDGVLSEFPHVICNQARVQDYFAEFAANSPARLRPDYGWALEHLEVSADPSATHPVTAHLVRSAGEDEGEKRTVRAKYAVGCDGAHSQVRRDIGGKMHGDSRNHAWGVMDVLADSDFPDYRTKCAIQSTSGSILYIPREGNSLVRIYVDLGEIPDGGKEKVRATPLSTIVETAQAIMRPYTLDVRHVAWWSVYEVGQRVTDSFDDVRPDERGSKHPRVFTAGDACHTHSAKAGQGMNVSMQDAFNLGWKLGHVLTGRAVPGLLDTYSQERQDVARKLIEFDREWSTLMGARTFDPEHPELGGVDPEEVTAHYVKSEEQASGFGVTYVRGQLLTSDLSDQSLADGFPLGKRFRSAPVRRHCDAVPVELGHHMRADGRWRIYVFADSAPAASEESAVRAWARWFAEDPSSPYVRTQSPNRGARDADWTRADDAGALFDVKVIYQDDHNAFEPQDVPDVFRPRFGPFQVRDQELVYAAEEGDDIFDRRGVSRDGAVIIVRPDMYVSAVLPLDRPELVGEFFAPILLDADAPAAVEARRVLAEGRDLLRERSASGQPAGKPGGFGGGAHAEAGVISTLGGSASDGEDGAARAEIRTVAEDDQVIADI
ncbi:FAD-dependent monooxygenase [Helcobacillus massiliensis]|uniref:Phenol 2-monooxygenase n=1 Tax=Helcobacillus massiliensis TaxID=521392 RepID=A0A839R2W7_9MICO|nr:FAD-dependent monooxygenase [Helcobacillus massiliensis]MBB3023536.1 phenol 2-monooxygenase [Helcobacillus massiliensis]